MKRVIAASRYLALVAVLSLLVASFSAVLWGAAKTVKAVIVMASSLGQDPLIAFYLIQLVDAFLVALVLFILGVSIYELFIGRLDLPPWMVISNLHGLKSRLGSAIVLVMAVRFVENLIQSGDAQRLLREAGAVALVSAALIAFSQFGDRD